MRTLSPTASPCPARRSDLKQRLALTVVLASMPLGCSKGSETQSEAQTVSKKEKPRTNEAGGGDKVGRSLEESRKAVEAAKAAAAQGDEPVKGQTAADGGVEPPPPGWQRLDLSTLAPSLVGTIDIPAMLELDAMDFGSDDADGLDAERPEVVIGPDEAGISLQPMASIPPRFASADAMEKFHSRSFDHVENHEFGPDHWVVVHRWDAEECMVHGWSGAAGLKCDSLKTPCKDVDQWVRACRSLRAGPTPNVVTATPKSAFPLLEAGAAELATTVARAIVRNDVGMLESAIGPAGLKVDDKAMTAEALKTSVARSSVVAVVSPLFDERMRAGTEKFNWGAGYVHQGKATVWFAAGFGEQPYFRLERTGTDWHLTEFGVKDQGED